MKPCVPFVAQRSCPNVCRRGLRDWLRALLRTPAPARRCGSSLHRLATADRAERLTHVEALPPRAATYADWPEWVHADVRDALAERGVSRLWAHQAQAADLAHAGGHVVMATGTASGKSLGYQLPALSASLAARGPRGERGATTLYIAPTKALAQDQLTSLQALGLGVRTTTHDGDSSREQRDWARDHGEYLLTNPDMLHRSLLPGHARWARFFGALQYVVVDECHHYRGRVRGARLPRAAPAPPGLRVVRRPTRRSCSPQPPWRSPTYSASG